MEQTADRQRRGNWESENDDRSANFVNCVYQTMGIISDRIGLENPGAEQGSHNQNEPPTADRPTNWLQIRPNGDQEGKNTGAPTKECQSHHPTKTSDLIFADHAPGWVEFAFQKMKQEKYEEKDRCKND